MKLNNRGFTLVELIVVMAIFIIVIMITGDAFKTILSTSTKLFKSEESNIEGVVGLEMMRHDIEQSGFGLFDSFMSVAAEYTEADKIPALTYNDAPSGVPRAVIGGNNLGEVLDPNADSDGVKYTTLLGADYLTIKATSAGLNQASQRWTYITGSDPPHVWPSDNLSVGDRVIIQRRVFNANGISNQLVFDPNHKDIYWVNFATGGFVTEFSPVLPQETYYVYGINPDGNLRMPFNRTDYFVATPSVANRLPATCAQKTGILYKTVVNHSNGRLTYLPVVDCVADMQVVFGWNFGDSAGSVVTDPNTLGSGTVDTWSNADGSVVSSSVAGVTVTNVQDAMANAGHIRTKLKLIKVYILAQDGRKDPNYTSPSPIQIGEASENDVDAVKALTRPGGYTVPTEQLNYRWKQYRLVIKPKNLLSNQ